MVAYPAALPLECVQTVINIVRNREVEAKKVEFAHCLWNVLGFALKALIGEPTEHDHDMSFFGQPSPELDQIQEMFDCLEEVQRLPILFGAEDKSEADPITIIVTLLPLILQLLKALGIVKKPAPEPKE